MKCHNSIYHPLKQEFNFFFIKRVLFWVLILLLFFIFLLPSSENKAHAITFDTPQYNWGNVTGQTITIWGNEADLYRPYMLKAFKRYEDLTGNKIKLKGFSFRELDRRLPEAFILNVIERPDILLTPGGTTIENLNPNVNFYDFTDAIWVDDLTDTAINQTIYDKKVIGLPYWEASVAGMIYNKEIFKKFNINVPTNQEEFLNVCAKLLKNGITPVYLPYAESTMMLYQFPLDSVVHTPWIMNALNNNTLFYSQIPEMKKIVSWYKTMSDKGYFGKNYLRNDWDGMNDAMLKEKHAMMICWDTWLYTDFTGNPARFGLMPAFMGVPPQGSFEGPNLMLLIANKQSEKLPAALDLITFIADPYNYNITLAKLYTAPVFKNQTASISTPQYVESERLIEKLFYDSTARLRIRGFSQSDAIYIQAHMQDNTYTIDNCLKDMDAARMDRATKNN